MENLKEYIVTVKNHCDLKSLYDDLETPGGSETIPDREVECSNRTPYCRCTHYFLSEEEVISLLNDDRIECIESLDLLHEAKPRREFIQSSSDWDRSSIDSSNDNNWGLYRCERGVQISGWGNDGTPNLTGIITTTSTGKNVDVVIVDDILDPNDPEFAVNSDGTGGSRVVQYNWFQHNLEVTGGANGTYVYDPYATGNEPHGTHVAGICVGNTNGWARDANIYNIFPYGSISGNPSLIYSQIIDYIRRFHATKPVNPQTGVKNPTIVNNSWSINIDIFRTGNTSGSLQNLIYWRGNYYYGPFTDEQLETYGLMNYNASEVSIYSYSDTYNQKLLQAQNEGIIFVGAGGNDSMKMVYDVPGEIERSNAFRGPSVSSGNVLSLYYHLGNSVGAGSSTICVGASSASVTESKRAFSASGPRVNTYAPGTNIQSSYLDQGAVPDLRNASFTLNKVSGTSMACPQVSGLIACLAEQYPRLTQQQSISYIEKYWKYNQLLDTGGGYTDENSLQGSPNIYAFHQKERKISGLLQPRTEYWIRPNSGNVWPRRNMVVFGR